MCPMKEDFPAFNIALGKTLIAAAWVDGELNQHVIVCLKNLILQFRKRSINITIGYTGKIKVKNREK